MTLNNEEPKPHSAEYFGESRDFWWNRDFLELMAKRLNFNLVQSALDVGCGIGHWGQLLSSVLPEKAHVTGIDREDTWVAMAHERAQAFGLGNRYHYQRGDVTALPFADNQFDLVTCQTVLIHLKDPKSGLREMLRVLKPTGRLLIAEPNNFMNRAAMSSLTENLSVDEVIDRLRFDLMVERGKQKLGLGFNSLGDFIPGYLAELGAQQIQVYLSDKTTPFFSPYESKEQQVNIKQMKEWAQRQFIGWDREEVLSYFVAGGGQPDEFDRYFHIFNRDLEQTLIEIEKGTYHSAGGSAIYLVSAQKQ